VLTSWMRRLVGETGSESAHTTRHSVSYHDLREAMAQPGCAICRLAADVAERYLDFLLWERVMEPDLRRELRQARGFCREHAWQLVRPGSSTGIAELMQDILHELLQTLEVPISQEPPPVSRKSLPKVRTMLDVQSLESAMALSDALKPQADQRCPACVQCQIMEEIYLDTLLDSLPDADDLLAVYQASDGLCLPHFRRALGRVHSQVVFETLVAAQRIVWQRLVDQLHEVLRKNDYRYQDEPSGEEADAWTRAIAALVGPQAGRSKPRRWTSSQ
jgi:hypothetical protein